jgi:hypothetical protein
MREFIKVYPNDYRRVMEERRWEGGLASVQKQPAQSEQPKYVGLLAFIAFTHTSDVRPSYVVCAGTSWWTSSTKRWATLRT